MQNVLVSVIIITYKRPLKIIQRAINSVLNQTYKNLQIIIVNDCPEDVDGVIAIKSLLCEINDRRIEYVVHEKNMGACRARNTGILCAKGEYVALLDDDDEWLPEKIEKQLSGFSEKEVGMVYSPFYNIDTNPPEQLTIRGIKSGELTEDLLWTNCIGGSSMTMIRRSAFDVCGLFDERLLASQDYDMWLRISESFKIVCINEPLTRRFLLEDSITKNFAKKQQGFDLFMLKHNELYKKHPNALNYRFNVRAKKCLEQGHFIEAKRCYLEALNAKFFSKYNITEPIKGILKYIIEWTKLNHRN